MDNKKVVLLARTDSKSKSIDDCLDFVLKTAKDCGIGNAIVCIMDTDKQLKDKQVINDIEVTFLFLGKQVSKPSGVLNAGISEVRKGGFDAFFIISKEVKILPKHYTNMVERFNGEEDKLLAVGYRLQETLAGAPRGAGQPSPQEGIAFVVPWNTCILWNALLFNKVVGGFDAICNGGMGSFVLENFNPPLVTEFCGMEDGLALAKVASEQSRGYYAVLFNESVRWLIPNEPMRISDHRKKLARKSIVLRAFINARGYSEEKLRNFVKVE